MDDIFVVWKGSKDMSLEFIQKLNSFKAIYITLQFTDYNLDFKGENSLKNGSSHDITMHPGKDIVR